MNYAQIVDICCRDLRRYLEDALKNTRGGVVSVKTSRVAPDETSRWPYGQCLASLLRRYRLRTTYVLTRDVAEELLRNLDKLCSETKEKEKKQYKKQPLRFGEKMVLISFHLPPAMLKLLDEYARERNMTRSAVIRYAVAKLLEKMKIRQLTPVQASP